MYLTKTKGVHTFEMYCIYLQYIFEMFFGRVPYDCSVKTLVKYFFSIPRLVESLKCVSE